MASLLDSLPAPRGDDGVATTAEDAPPPTSRALAVPSLATQRARELNVVARREQRARGFGAIVPTAAALVRPAPEDEAATAARTARALEAEAADAAEAAGTAAATRTTADAAALIARRATRTHTLVSYETGAAPASGVPARRMVRITAAPEDPLEPARFRLRKTPRAAGVDAPEPQHRSPPRAPTAAERAAWDVPPALSNWKNNRGFTVPTHTRVAAADGSGRQPVALGSRFASFADALQEAERAARADVQRSADLERQLRLKRKEVKERRLAELATEARAARLELLRGAGGAVASAGGGGGGGGGGAGGVEPEELADLEEREAIREQRRREVERDVRLERHRSAASRNAQRDVAERLALGQGLPSASRGAEALFDQRLFDHTRGVASGFADDEAYSVYSQPLFAGAAAAAGIYRPRQVDEETYGTNADLAQLRDTSKFQPARGFGAADAAAGGGSGGAAAGGSEAAAAARGGQPVQFEKAPAPPTAAAAEDMFGLEQFLSDAKSASVAKQRDPLAHVGHRGTMVAAAGGGGGGRGGGGAEEVGRAPKRARFQSGGVESVQGGPSGLY